MFSVCTVSQCSAELNVNIIFNMTNMTVHENILLELLHMAEQVSTEYRQKFTAEYKCILTCVAVSSLSETAAFCMLCRTDFSFVFLCFNLHI